MKLKDYEIPQYGPEDNLAQEDLAQYSLKNFDPSAPPNEPGFRPAPDPARPAPAPLALDAYDVQFGPHFHLQQPLYIPSSPSQSWKMPRWVVATVGLFFGSAAVLTITVCVVLLRDPAAPPTAPSPAPTATAPSDVARAPSAPAPDTTTRPAVAERAAVRHSAAPARRVVRRPLRGARPVVATSSVAPQETQTVSRRPPPDDLDKLLGESSL